MMCSFQKKGSIAWFELALAPQNTPFLRMPLADGLHTVAGSPGNYCVGVTRVGKTTSVRPVVCLARGSDLEIISGELWAQDRCKILVGMLFPCSITL